MDTFTNVGLSLAGTEASRGGVRVIAPLTLALPFDLPVRWPLRKHPVGVAELPVVMLPSESAVTGAPVERLLANRARLIRLTALSLDWWSLLNRRAVLFAAAVMLLLVSTTEVLLPVIRPIGSAIDAAPVERVVLKSALPFDFLFGWLILPATTVLLAATFLELLSLAILPLESAMMFAAAVTLPLVSTTEVLLPVMRPIGSAMNGAQLMFAAAVMPLLVSTTEVLWPVMRSIGSAIHRVQVFSGSKLESLVILPLESVCHAAPVERVVLKSALPFEFLFGRSVSLPATAGLLASAAGEPAFHAAMVERVVLDSALPFDFVRRWSLSKSGVALLLAAAMLLVTRPVAPAKRVVARGADCIGLSFFSFGFLLRCSVAALGYVSSCLTF